MGKLPSLNGLRAMSVFIVILHHLSLNNNATFITKHQFLMPFYSFFTDGQFGVNVFFVISGYLITLLLIAEKQKTGRISLKDFYIRRTLRIFPAYYFLLLVYFVFTLLGLIQITGASWLTSLTYTKYFNSNLDIYTAHFWSLSIEEHFYLCWPFVFTFCSDRFCKIALIVIVIAVAVTRCYVYYYPVSFINDLTIFLRLDSIATGCFFALYKDRILRVFSKNWRYVFYLSIICMCAIPYIQPFLDNIGWTFLTVALGARHGTIANIVIAVIMMYCVYGPRKSVYKFLNLKFINYIGLLSYSLYLWQQYFVFKATNSRVELLINMALLFLAANFSHYIIERPFIKLKTRFSVGKKTSPAIEANTDLQPN